MHCYCKDEFDWFMRMLKKGDCFSYWEDVAEFIDEDFLELRYMNKRFGYLFYDDYVYIKKVNGRNAICVNKGNILFVVNLIKQYILVQFHWKTQSVLKLSI